MRVKRIFHRFPNLPLPFCLCSPLISQRFLLQSCVFFSNLSESFDGANQQRRRENVKKAINSAKWADFAHVNANRIIFIANRRTFTHSLRILMKIRRLGITMKFSQPLMAISTSVRFLCVPNGIFICFRCLLLYTITEKKRINIIFH